jgi:hypothetical protein
MEPPITLFAAVDIPSLLVSFPSDERLDPTRKLPNSETFSERLSLDLIETALPHSTDPRTERLEPSSAEEINDKRYVNSESVTDKIVKIESPLLLRRLAELIGPSIDTELPKHAFP